MVGVKDRTTGRVTARPVLDVSARSLTEAVSESTSPPVVVFTDEWRSYRPLTAMGYHHAKVEHGSAAFLAANRFAPTPARHAGDAGCRRGLVRHGLTRRIRTRRGRIRRARYPSWLSPVR